MRCIVCKGAFIPERFLQKTCNLECAIEFTNQKKAKEWALRKSEMKDTLKTWSDYYQEALKLFNEYIRLRDKDKPCISCDAPAGTYRITAGHFHPQGTYKAVAMHEDNVQGQCWNNCNRNKHGNLSEYRPRLIKRIGLERVEEIDRLRNTDFKASIPELIQIKVKYRKKIKALKSQ